MVEFTAADRVADRSPVFGSQNRAADPARAEPGHRLQQAVPAVVGRVNLQRVENRRRDPPGTRLAAWKERPVEDDDVQAGGAELADERIQSMEMV